MNSIMKENKTKSLRGGKPSKKKTKRININKYRVLSNKDVKLLYDITGKTISILNKHKINYWATDGTLLGTIRNKGFIPWDDDIDIAIDIKDKQNLRSLKDVFATTNLKLVGVGKYMKVKHPTNKHIWIDIFILTKGKFPQGHFSHLTFDENNVKAPLKKKKFGPLKLNVPHNSEDYLHRIFKDWDKLAYIYNHQKKKKEGPFYFKDHPELKKS